CYRLATEREYALRKRPGFDSFPFAVLRRTFACTPRFLAVLRVLCVEWRRRESNPRPQSHRQSVYKLRLPLNFARRPVGSRPTAGLAILWCRASGDWLSLGAEPVSDAATRATGRARSDALRYGLGSESECVILLRTCVCSRLFYEADRGPRLAALP